MAGDHFLQRSHGYVVRPPDEQLLSRVALPAAGTVQRGHQPGDVKVVESRDGARLLVHGIDAIDAALVVTETQVECLFQFVVDVFRMVDAAARHVDHPDRPVRSGVSIRWAEPDVAGDEKFRLLLVERPFAVEGDSVGRKDLAVQHVENRVAHEQIASIGGAEQVVAVDHQAAQRGPKARLPFRQRWRRLTPVAEHTADRVDVSIGRDVQPSRRRCEMGIAAEVMIGQHIVPAGLGVVQTEPVPPVVPIAAVLRGTGLRIHQPFVHTDAKVASVDVRYLTGLYRSDFSATPAVGHVHPVVQPPARMIDEQLRVADIEPGKQGLPKIGPAIAVGILGVEHFRCSGDHNPLAPGFHSRGKANRFQEHGRFVVAAVAIGVFQEADPASGYSRRYRQAEMPVFAHPQRVVGHFDDPELPVGTPGDVDRVHHQRLCHHQFHLEPSARLQRRQRLPRRSSRRLHLVKHEVVGEISGVQVVRAAFLVARVFVLHPHVPVFEPGAVVGPIGTDDHRQGVGILARTGPGLTRPTFGDRGEQVDRVARGVGEDHVGMAVFVDVHEAQTGVASPGIDDRRALREGKGEPGPGMAIRGPTERALLFLVADHQFTGSVAVQVAESHTPVAAARASVDVIQTVQPVPVLHPFLAVEMPDSGLLFVAHQNAGVAVRLQHTETYARIMRIALRIRCDDLHGQLGRGPLASLGRPDPRLADTPVADDHVHVAVVVKIQQTHAVVLALRVAKRLPGQKVFRQAVVHLGICEESYLLAVLAVGVVDYLDDLLAPDISHGMEQKRVDTTLDDGRVDACLHVADGERVVGLVEILGCPVTEQLEGHFPAEPADDVRVRVVLNGVDEVMIGRHVLREPLAALFVEHQFSRQGRIVGREDLGHRRTHRQEVACRRGSVEDLGIEARADRVMPVAARHPERHRPVGRQGHQLVDAAVVLDLGRGEVVVTKAGTRMRERVPLHA